MTQRGAILKGLSIKRLLTNPGAMRTPRWHANANDIGTDTAEFITFGNERPEDFGLGAAFAMTDAVLGNAYNLPGFCSRQRLLRDAMHRRRQTASQSGRQTQDDAKRSKRLMVAGTGSQ